MNFWVFKFDSLDFKVNIQVIGINILYVQTLDDYKTLNLENVRESTIMYFMYNTTKLQANLDLKLRTI